MIKLSECEEQVMIIIWNSKEPPSMQMIREEVNSRFDHTWAPQTVSTFLMRLVRKGCLQMERKGRYVYYEPVMSLEQYRRERLQSLVEMLYNGDKESAAKDVLMC